MKRSITTVVKGGLLTSATVMGVDASINHANAMPMTDVVRVPFSLTVVDPDPNALTCCPDVALDLLFDPFDTSRGNLLGVQLAFESQQALQSGGGAVSVLASVSLDGNILSRTVGLGEFNFTADLLNGPVTFSPRFFQTPFNLNLASTVVTSAPDILDWEGSATITYSFNATVIPEPNTIVLLLTAFGLGASGRRWGWY